MKEKRTLVFGYGSLLNKKSARMIGEFDILSKDTILNGYQRNFNAIHGDFMSLNIVPKKESVVVGTVIAVSGNSLTNLLERESKYEMVDVTKLVNQDFGDRVFTFITNPEVQSKQKKIRLSYLAVCLAGVKKSGWLNWLNESFVNNEIFDDRANPPVRLQVENKDFLCEVINFIKTKTNLNITSNYSK